MEDAVNEFACKTNEEITREADVLSTLLISTPSLRARFFANPTSEVGKNLPPAKSWDYARPLAWWCPWLWPGSPFRFREERKRLAKAMLINIEHQVAQLKLKASVNADSVYEEYFAPIVQVSQRSFAAVCALSIAAFAAGIALIAVGAYVAIASPAGTNSTVVASIFGGSGAASALGSVYTMSTSGIREATADLARVRVVMTAFATQLGQLLAIIEKQQDDTGTAATAAAANPINTYIGSAMNAALAGIPSLNEATN